MVENSNEQNKIEKMTILYKLGLYKYKIAEHIITETTFTFIFYLYIYLFV